VARLPAVQRGDRAQRSSIKLAVYTLPLLAWVWMFIQWQQSIAASLAAESAAVQEQEPDLALQLARHALPCADSEDTRAALFGALQNARWIKSYLARPCARHRRRGVQPERDAAGLGPGG